MQERLFRGTWIFLKGEEWIGVGLVNIEISLFL
uniref:Mitochondrial proteolipid n=1 Tax=Podoviridae sp. ctuQh21 TaxID=2825284 RepID=A0A8S5PFY6_9CAUD|nr:MAG TPA: Mitochondrial proteolipid [Podoviridae sp. ctuQh21]DAT13871.1 MAG TPA: Mitochondrial proteolipid [Caudoviricetes sp.]